MPISTEVRKYRETAVKQGKAQGKAALDQGKAALDQGKTQGKAALVEARKPLLAAIGATDLAYDQIRTQLRDLPAETQAWIKDAQAQLKKLQERAQRGVDSLSTDNVRHAAETAAETTRQAYDGYLSLARDTYQSLAHRGDLVVRRLRRSPEVRNAFDETEKLLDRAEKLVEHAEQAVTTPAPRPSTAPVSKATTSAPKAPAAANGPRKSTARKSTSAKA